MTDLRIIVSDAGHFVLMAAFTFVVIGTGPLASLQPTGWWLPAWVTGVLPVFIGLASLVFAEAASSLDQLWGFAAILWGAGFVAAAEFSQNPDSPTLLGRWANG